MDEEQILLARYVKDGDAAAFAELVRQHAGAVGGVCTSVLRNAHDAEEVTQECFLDLARDAGRVHSSVGGWLRRVATSRSLNELRSRVRRRLRERVVGGELVSSLEPRDLTQQELHLALGRILGDLPEELRRPVLLHYFDGKSQRDVALELGVNQSTISRRMQDALQQVREQLARSGYAASAPAFVALLQNQAEAAGSKSGIMQVAQNSPVTAAWVATMAGWAKAVVAAAIPACSLLAFGGWMSLLIAICLAAYVGCCRPKWVAETYASLGVDGLYDRPTFCLSRWTWRVPPIDWRSQVIVSLIWSATFLSLSLTFAHVTSPKPWGTVTLSVLLAVACVAQAIRIAYRVWLLRRCHAAKQQAILVLDPAAMVATGQAQVIRSQAIPGSQATLRSQKRTRSREQCRSTWFEAVQLIGVGLSIVAIAVAVARHRPDDHLWPSILLCVVVGAGMGYRAKKLYVPKSEIISRDEAVTPRHDALQRPAGTQVLSAFGATIVVALSCWIVWNPSHVRGLPLSLAAVQTSMLGWMFYRLAASRGGVELSATRRVIMAILASCFVLNSGVSFANWLN